MRYREEGFLDVHMNSFREIQKYGTAKKKAGGKSARSNTLTADMMAIYMAVATRIAEESTAAIPLTIRQAAEMTNMSIARASRARKALIECGEILHGIIYNNGRRGMISLVTTSERHHKPESDVDDE